MDLARVASSAFLLLLLLLAGPCAAARLGPPAPTPTPTTTTATTTLSLAAPSNGARHHPHKTGFRYRGHVYSYLPKNTDVPPSGPSPRHNSAVTSAPGT
ncbi:hypothetical protein NL676_037775 [Syzygium grande]|nr:hypothetical protein NL676_037775 [Syzygium grande]